MNKSIVVGVGCGGYGRSFVGMTRRRLGSIPGHRFRVADASAPKGVSRANCIEIAPQQLPATPTPHIAELIRMTAIKNVEEYRQWRELVSSRGLVQAPLMSWIAAMVKLPEIKEAIEMDVRTAAEEVGGAERCILLTVASLLGGTGSPTARAVGIGFRLAAVGAFVPHEARWIHVALTSSVLGDVCRTRRTLALERRQMEELEALMQPGAALRIPGQLDPVRCPGPDEVVLIASSPEAPRSLEDAAEELAATIRHWLR